MARGKRLLSLEEQLAKVVEDIATAEKTLQELNDAKKDIEEKIRVRNMEELDALIVKEGKTYEEIKAMILGNSTSVGKKKWCAFLVTATVVVVTFVMTDILMVICRNMSYNIW